MEKQELLDKIDSLTLSICRLMSPEQKNEFFEYQEARIESGECYKKKYYVGRTYYKGEKKGQELDVYDVDGEGFIKLWRLLEPFAMKTVSNFFRTRKIFSGEDEDTLFEIKFQTLRILRFFGPTPSGKPFSSIFNLFCKNILTNECQKRYGTKDIYFTAEEVAKLSPDKAKLLQFVPSEATYKLTSRGGGSVIHPKFSSITEDEGIWVLRGKVANKTKVNYLSVSLFNEVMVEEGEEGNWAINYLPSSDNNAEDIEFQASIPDDLKETVNSLINGHSLKETSEITGMKFNQMKRVVKEFAEDFCN